MDPVTLALTLAARYAPDFIKYLTNSDTAGNVATVVLEAAREVKGTHPDAPVPADMTNDQADDFRNLLYGQEKELITLANADRADARARDIALHASGHRNVRADLMVLLDVVGLITCLVVLCFWRDQIPGEVVGLISTIAATFGLCLRDAHQFEFGSSRTSKEKDQTISNLSK